MEFPMPYQAAIFDMDGLLLDTERLCMQAFQKACQKLSLPFVQSAYVKIIGCNEKGIEIAIMDHYAQYIDYPTLRKTWMEGYWPIVETQAIPIKPGVIELLEWFKSQNIPVSVATSTHQALAKTKLTLAGLASYFEHISSGCEVTNSKPHPEIFLLAAQRLKVSPQQCLVFEDSNNGVRAAIAANMQVYQIPDIVIPDQEIVNLGHQIEPSLIEVLAHLKMQ
jgi:beta-phosphoglucomutase-like phosphatase (HAD superfamily)